MTIKVFVTNLGAYSRGELVGEWLELPMDEEELKAAINSILETPYKDEEFFITDYEAPIEIGEYENIYALNELAEELESVCEDEKTISVIADDVLGNGYARNELLRVLKDREYSVVSDVWDEEDLALKVDEELLPFDYNIVRNTGIDNYLDWDSIGRSMVLDGWTIKDGIGVKVYL